MCLTARSSMAIPRACIAVEPQLRWRVLRPRRAPRRRRGRRRECRTPQVYGPLRVTRHIRDFKMRSQTVSVGVIGCGYWGPNVIRNFFEAPGAEVVACCDADPRRLDGIRQRFPSVKTVQSPRALFTDPAIDAVAIVTPLRTHYA